MLFQRECCLLLALVLGCVSWMVSGLSLDTSRILDNEAEYTCYRSSSSEAKNITTVYDDHTPNGDFWYWNNSLLVTCNFSHIYSSSCKCSVCMDDSVRPETVIVVFSNLSSSVQPVFEGQGTRLRFNQTVCPPAEQISTTTPGTTERPPKANDEGGWTHLYTILVCIGVVAIVVAIIIIVLIIYLVCKRKPNKTAANEPNNVLYKPVNDSVQIDMNGNGHVGPPAE